MYVNFLGRSIDYLKSIITPLNSYRHIADPHYFSRHGRWPHTTNIDIANKERKENECQTT